MEKKADLDRAARARRELVGALPGPWLRTGFAGYCGSGGGRRTRRYRIALAKEVRDA